MYSLCLDAEIPCLWPSTDPGYGATVVPYWPHALQHFVMTHLPLPIVERFVFSHHAGIRARALKKKAKAQ